MLLCLAAAPVSASLVLLRCICCKDWPLIVPTLVTETGRSFYSSTYTVHPQPLMTALLAGDARLLGSACWSVSSLKSVQISWVSKDVLLKIPKYPVHIGLKWQLLAQGHGVGSSSLFQDEKVCSLSPQTMLSKTGIVFIYNQ